MSPREVAGCQARSISTPGKRARSRWPGPLLASDALQAYDAILLCPARCSSRDAYPAGDARPGWKFDDFKRATSQARHGKIAVLQFHGVPDTAPDWVTTSRKQFETYMRYLRDNRFQVIALRDLAKYVDSSVTPIDPWGAIRDRQHMLEMMQSGRTARPAEIEAEDWPQWRGPNRDGVWRETGILKTFPPGGLTIRWRAPVGFGWSSPVVAQGRVYVTDSRLERPKAWERVHCFNEDTGKLHWTHSDEVRYPDWAFEPAQRSGPRATPIVQSGKLYTLGATGHLFCLDALTGSVIWKKSLAKDYGLEGFSGITPSPLIERDLLILVIGGKPEACVVALDKNSGKEIWRALAEPWTYSSPIVLTAGRRRQLIVWTPEAVTSLDPATGATYWRERLNTGGDYAVATPVFSRDLLLISGLMLQLDPDKPAASVLWPATKAQSRRILSNTSVPLIRGEYVFSAKSSGQLVCLEARTGKQVRETDKVTDLKNGASIHLTPNGDSVFLYTDKGELIRARLTPRDYEEISRTALLEPTFPFGGRKLAWPPPAYASRHVFARNDKELTCASLAVKP